MNEKKKVSMEDVAKYCGLSTVTVSRVLNNASTVREYNRQKVLDAMKALNYVPDAAARTLAKGTTGIIGMITPKLQDPFFSHIIQEVNNCLIRHNMFLAISVTANQGCDYILQQQRVDGMVVLAPGMEDSFVPQLKASGVPFVVLDSHSREEDYSSILVDNFEGGYLAGQHFLRLGHRRIGFIGGPLSMVNSAERQQGLEQALKEQGISLSCAERGEFTFRDGYQIMTRWILNDMVPTAVFAADCNLAIGAITALKEHGIPVPGQVSVCGFDDEPLAREYVPALTIVAQPTAELAERAIEQLLCWIGGKQPAQLVYRLKPRLIIRDSTSVCQGTGALLSDGIAAPAGADREEQEGVQDK